MGLLGRIRRRKVESEQRKLLTELDKILAQSIEKLGENDEMVLIPVNEALYTPVPLKVLIDVVDFFENKEKLSEVEQSFYEDVKSILEGHIKI
ncbi:MAG: hypothetical protein QXT97_02440 [Candidatus Diapherotrites archaeon]